MVSNILFVLPNKNTIEKSLETVGCMAGGGSFHYELKANLSQRME